MIIVVHLKVIINISPPGNVCTRISLMLCPLNAYIYCKEHHIND